MDNKPIKTIFCAQKMKFEKTQRLLDLLISVIILPVCLVLIALLCLITVIIDREPPLFFQTRLGRHKKPFTIIKMRTYSKGTPIAPTHKISHLPMLSVGNLYRNLRLDELPQIINVIRGDMSLVGPRPCLPMQIELINLRQQAGIFDLRPGISGLSQVNGVDMSNPNALVAKDSAMINLNITTYFLVLWTTILPSLITRKG